MRGFIYFIFLFLMSCGGNSDPGDSSDVVLEISMGEQYRSRLILEDRRSYIDYRAMDESDYDEEKIYQ